MVNSEKIVRLAEIIVNHSISVKKGDKILLRAYGFEGYPLIKEIYREAVKAGALKIDVRFSQSELARIFYQEASDEQLEYVGPLAKDIAESYDCMVQIVADQNPYELTDIDPKKKQKVMKAMKPISDIYGRTRWCLFYYPNSSSAQTAQKSLSEWEDFVFDSCLVDWPKVEEMEKKFIEKMLTVKKVRITGEETDLELSIDGQKWKTCCGRRNLPDGEIFTAPVRESVNGVIRYNVPTRYRGKDFEWVKLTLEKGKVVKAESNNQKALEEILDTDEGARYYGEFAFGLNDNIQNGTRQILFDEKMGKSLHMALGKCYEECPNGNDSTVHWDLIYKFKPAKAKIYFDDQLVYDLEQWVDKDLEFLNNTQELFSSKTTGQ